VKKRYREFSATIDFETLVQLPSQSIILLFHILLPLP
jgi:hypothetical protein